MEKKVVGGRPKYLRVFADHFRRLLSVVCRFRMEALRDLTRTL